MHALAGWLTALAPIYGVAALVFIVYALAKYGIWDTKRPE